MGMIPPIHKVAVKVKGWCTKKKTLCRLIQTNAWWCHLSIQQWVWITSMHKKASYMEKLWKEFPHVSILALVWINSVYFMWRDVLFQPPGHLISFNLKAAFDPWTFSTSPGGERAAPHWSGNPWMFLDFLPGTTDFTKSRWHLDISMASLKGNLEKLKGA